MAYEDNAQNLEEGQSAAFSGNLQLRSEQSLAALLSGLSGGAEVIGLSSMVLG